MTGQTRRIKDAELLDRPGVRRVFALLNRDGEEARLVGGSVRNLLMGLPISDMDICTTALPDTVLARAAADGIHAVPTGYVHGTITLVVDGVPHEVTTLREDIETDGRRAVVRYGRDGSCTVVVDAHEGRKLNSPNDVVVATDGAVWFTDPPYGIESNYEGYKAESEQTGNHVYRFDPATGTTRIAAGDFDRPNGLAFSPDGRILYIADSGASRGAAYGDEAFVPSRPHHIRAFDVSGEGMLSNDRVFAVIDAGVPDGIRVDAAGNVWTSAWDGVRVHAPDGTMILKIALPEMVSNLCFGAGQLWITATTSVYRVALA
ncbi:MAG: SMP-30/gluconolactonase/LRE family protein [Proteobacteria bacterium]|nr:SMP-30/gluconolactonase/LRE family protein [Pseudomonadota bacterium]